MGTRRDPLDRLKEHKNASKNYKAGDEDKYRYSSALDALGIEWTLEVLHTLEYTDSYNHDDTEDFYVNKYRDHPLMNMRAGNHEPWFGVSYPNVEAMVAARKRYLDRLKFKEPKVKVKTESDVDKMLYSFEKPHERFVSPAFKALKKRRGK